MAHYEKASIFYQRLHTVFRSGTTNLVTTVKSETIFISPGQWIKVVYVNLPQSPDPAVNLNQVSNISRIINVDYLKGPDYEEGDFCTPSRDCWGFGSFGCNYYTQGYRCDVCDSLYRTSELAIACEKSPVPLPKFTTGDLLQGPRGGFYVVQKIIIEPTKIGHHLEYNVRSLLGGLSSIIPGTFMKKVSSVDKNTGWRKAKKQLGL
jgi:hypothetical protein